MHACVYVSLYKHIYISVYICIRVPQLLHTHEGANLGLTQIIRKIYFVIDYLQEHVNRHLISRKGVVLGDISSSKPLLLLC